MILEYSTLIFVRFGTKSCKKTRICSESRDFAQNRNVNSLEVLRNGLIVNDIFYTGPIAKVCAPSLAIFWLQA